MSNTVPSANMSLPIPIVSQAPGPEWASDINACLTIVDAHNHAAGYGVPINPDGMNINSDLTMNSNDLIAIRTTRFSAQSGPLSDVTDIGCLYESGVDLYYNDGLGNQVRITQSGGVAGSPGSIASLSSPASATYVAGTETFVWQSDANTPANLDAASVILRNLVVNSKGLTLNPPNAMGSNYSITLPTLPGATSFLTMDSSGNIGASPVISGGLTKSYIAALGQQICTSVTFSTSSTSFVDVTALTVTLTTTGRPVWIGLMPGTDSTTGSAAQLTTSVSAGTSTAAQLKVVRDSTDIAFWLVGESIGASAIQIVSRYACSSFTCIDIPSAGSHTYKFQVKAVGTSVSLNFVKVSLVAYEL